MKKTLGFCLILGISSCTQDHALEAQLDQDFSEISMTQYIDYQSGNDLRLETCFSRDQDQEYFSLGENQLRLNNEVLETSFGESLLRCDRVAYLNNLPQESLVPVASEILDSEGTLLEDLSYEFKIDRISPGAIFEGVDLVFSLGIGIFTAIDSSIIEVRDSANLKIYENSITFDSETQISSISIPASVFSGSNDEQFYIISRISYRSDLSSDVLEGGFVYVSLEDTLTLQKTSL